MTRSHYTDPGEARAHVERLVAAFPLLHLTPSHVTRLAGVHRDVLRHDRPNITIESAERILAVRPQHVRLMPPRHIDAEPSRAAIRHLMSATCASANVIGTAAGISGMSVLNVLKGQPSVRHATHIAITGLDVSDVEHRSLWVQREPTRRRVHALRANGWSMNALTAMVGSNVNRLNSLDGLIHTSIARQVQFVYDRIGDEVGPSPETLRRARNEGHLPPIHYDDNMVLVEADPTSRRRDRDRLALCILALTVEGHPTVDIARRLGTSGRHIGRVRASSGLRVRQVGDGLYEPIETHPGQFAAIRAIARDIHIWSTLDALDAPELDYAAMVDSVKSSAAA